MARRASGSSRPAAPERAEPHQDHHYRHRGPEDGLDCETNTYFEGHPLPYSKKPIGVTGIEPAISPSRTVRDTTSLHPDKSYFGGSLTPHPSRSGFPSVYAALYRSLAACRQRPCTIVHEKGSPRRCRRRDYFSDSLSLPTESNRLVRPYERHRLARKRGVDTSPVGFEPTMDPSEGSVISSFTMETLAFYQTRASSEGFEPSISGS